jgi:hypothetical protein
MADGEKHRHCGVITSGTKNMTTANGEVTLQFHSNAEDHLAMPAPAIAALEAEKSGVHPYKGFWVHFEGDILLALNNCKFKPPAVFTCNIYTGLCIGSGKKDSFDR